MRKVVGACAALDYRRAIENILETQMRSMKHVLAATAMILVLSASAEAADCKRIGVDGEALGQGVAELFSKNGLKNVIYGQGREGRGPVRTTCKSTGATTTCHSSQMACKVTSEKACLGAWLCAPM